MCVSLFVAVVSAAVYPAHLSPPPPLSPPLITTAASITLSAAFITAFNADFAAAALPAHLPPAPPPPLAVATANIIAVSITLSAAFIAVAGTIAVFRIAAVDFKACLCLFAVVVIAVAVSVISDVFTLFPPLCLPLSPTVSAAVVAFAVFTTFIATAAAVITAVVISISLVVAVSGFDVVAAHVAIFTPIAVPIVHFADGNNITQSQKCPIC